MKKKNCFITGTSKGLGLAIAEQMLAQGARVYGCARSASTIEHVNYSHQQIDLSQLAKIGDKLDVLLDGVQQLDEVILNAGLLGDIKSISDFSQLEIESLMDVNVWSNKNILDHVLKQMRIGEVVMVSSGAAVNGGKGWGAYSLSKATLNMLCQLYAAEYIDTHFISLAPGLIDTDMQAYLCDQSRVDEQIFPSIKRLRAARGTADMPSPKETATLILQAMPSLRQNTQSGQFVDIRNFW